MLAVLLRDIRLSLRRASDILTGLLFFAAIITLTPFAIGPDPEILSRIGPGILWIGALLSTLLGLDRLFQSDRDDGSLDLYIINHYRRSLTATVLTKCCAHWICTALPLVIASPILGLMLNLPTSSILAVLLTLVVGTPAMTLIGAVGAALAVSLPRGNLLISIIVLPLTMPILIFGVSATYAANLPNGAFFAPFLLLVALSLFFAVIGPFAASLALRYLSE